MGKTRHYVYHIFPKGDYSGKVGATHSIANRVEKQQGCSPKEYTILLETTSVKEASDAEIHFQKLYGYPVDRTPYEDLPFNKKKVVDTSSALKFVLSKNRDWYSNYQVNATTAAKIIVDEGLTIDGIHVAGPIEKYVDILQDSQWQGCYMSARAVDKLLACNGECEECDCRKDDAPQDAWETSTTLEEVAHKIGLGTKKNPNVCSDLDITNHTSVDLDKLMLMQKSLQNKFQETQISPDNTLTDIATMAQRNFTAFVDEYTEFMEAIGGVKDGVGNGAWKYWKVDHNIAANRTLADLSIGDLKELHMEVVDMFHFFMNFALMTGMSGSDLYNMYLAKNKENFARQDRGY